MKTYHYYCAVNPDHVGPFDAPQSETLATSMLTPEFVRRVVLDLASGSLPYRLIVPRWILYEVATWNFPESLLRLDVVDGKGDDNCDPVDTAIIQFGDSIALINARRCRPCSF